MNKRNFLSLLLVITGTIFSSIAFTQLGVGKESILMIFMIGVLLVTALARGYLIGILTSFISVMAFNFFFTEPLHTFVIYSTNDIVLILFFLIVSIISSSLTARFQRQLLISQKNEQTAKLLYEVSQRFLNVTGEGNIIHQAMRYIKEYTGYVSIVELIGNNQPYVSESFVPNSENCMALPITGLAKRLGTLKVYHNNIALDIEQEWLINTVGAQMGIALDREFVYKERESIRIAMEREHLKSNLLRSVSHDLRTPLTGIVGASSYIFQRAKSLDRESIEHLVGDIHEQAVWLTTLVENILNMTRIDNGKFEINKQIEVVEDVVYEAVTHVFGLSERSFKIEMPKEFIAIPMDGKMIVQVLVNLLYNAINHTPKNCPIELIVNQNNNYVEFCVADGGAGIDPSIKDNLFNAFVTSGKIGADGKKGIGLGLTICQAVVQAHGGSIDTGISHLGGALFKVILPNMEEE